MKELHCGKNIVRKYRSVIILLSALLAVVLLILSLKSIDDVLAYMFKRTEEVSNTLEPAVVSVDVEETFDGETKSDVSVRNNSSIPVYIRVILAEYWQKDGAYVPKPADGAVDIVMNGSGWLKSGEGVYYYTTPVAVGDKTTDLIQSATAALPEGYSYHLDIHAEAIQAKPEDAVTSSWHVTLDQDGETIIKVP